MADDYSGVYSGASHFAQRSEFEVQRTNHFEVVLNLSNILDGDPNAEGASEHIRLSTKSIGTPKVSAEPISLKHGNDTVKVAAAPTYEDLQLTVHDTLGKDQVALMQAWFNKVFDRKTKLMGRVGAYKTNGILYMYAPDGSVVRKWELEGVWPKGFGMGAEFSYDSSETMTITVDLSVDRYFEDTKINNIKNG